MSELEQVVAHFEKQTAIIQAEQMVHRRLLTLLLSRVAEQYERPDEFVITALAPIVSSLDKHLPEGAMAEAGCAHATEVCAETEQDALELLMRDESWLKSQKSDNQS